MNVRLIDGFAKDSEYWSSSIMRWNDRQPPPIDVADWSVADAGFGPHIVRYFFVRREGNIFIYSCQRETVQCRE